MRTHSWGLLSPSGMPAKQGISLWHKRSSLPLRILAQRELFMNTLKELCSSPRSEERDGTTVCVPPVQLAVCTRRWATPQRPSRRCALSASPRGCRSVCDVAAGLGTGVEGLREMRVCRRQGNLLDNPLLLVLLPAVSVDCLMILTCISVQVEYASRPCMDACYFECCSDRRWRPTAVWSLRVPAGAAPRGQRCHGQARAGLDATTASASPYLCFSPAHDG
ncbi:hypothetical protein MNV84_06423 [Leishmania braziliensis]|nr:hypothetical protein MNV84_06423 [Leishmania braziliensis]CAJ2478600.1 unnamed protein product [Leishmania braziliensis]